MTWSAGGSCETPMFIYCCSCWRRGSHGICLPPIRLCTVFLFQPRALWVRLSLASSKAYHPPSDPFLFPDTFSTRYTVPSLRHMDPLNSTGGPTTLYMTTPDPTTPPPNALGTDKIGCPGTMTYDPELKLLYIKTQPATPLFLPHRIQSSSHVCPTTCLHTP